MMKQIKRNHVGFIASTFLNANPNTLITCPVSSNTNMHREKVILGSLKIQIRNTTSNTAQQMVKYRVNKECVSIKRFYVTDKHSIQFCVLFFVTLIAVCGFHCITYIFLRCSNTSKVIILVSNN